MVTILKSSNNTVDKTQEDYTKARNFRKITDAISNVSSDCCSQMQFTLTGKVVQYSGLTEDAVLREGADVAGEVINKFIGLLQNVLSGTECRGILEVINKGFREYNRTDIHRAILTIDGFLEEYADLKDDEIKSICSEVDFEVENLNSLASALDRVLDGHGIHKEVLSNFLKRNKQSLSPEAMHESVESIADFFFSNKEIPGPAPKGKVFRCSEEYELRLLECISKLTPEEFGEAFAKKIQEASVSNRNELRAIKTRLETLIKRETHSGRVEYDYMVHRINNDSLYQERIKNFLTKAKISEAEQKYATSPDVLFALNRVTNLLPENKIASGIIRQFSADNKNVKEASTRSSFSAQMLATFFRSLDRGIELPKLIKEKIKNSKFPKQEGGQEMTSEYKVLHLIGQEASNTKFLYLISREIGEQLDKEPETKIEKQGIKGTKEALEDLLADGIFDENLETAVQNYKNSIAEERAKYDAEKADEFGEFKDAFLQESYEEPLLVLPSKFTLLPYAVKADIVRHLRNEGIKVDSKKLLDQATEYADIDFSKFMLNAVDNFKLTDADLKKNDYEEISSSYYDFWEELVSSAYNSKHEGLGYLLSSGSVLLNALKYRGYDRFKELLNMAQAAGVNPRVYEKLGEAGNSLAAYVVIYAEKSFGKFWEQDIPKETKEFCSKHVSDYGMSLCSFVAGTGSKNLKRFWEKGINEELKEFYHKQVSNLGLSLIAIAVRYSPKYYNILWKEMGKKYPNILKKHLERGKSQIFIKSLARYSSKDLMPLWRTLSSDVKRSIARNSVNANLALMIIENNCNAFKEFWGDSAISESKTRFLEKRVDPSASLAMHVLRDMPKYFKEFWSNLTPEQRSICIRQEEREEPTLLSYIAKKYSKDFTLIWDTLTIEDKKFSFNITSNRKLGLLDDLLKSGGEHFKTVWEDPAITAKERSDLVKQLGSNVVQVAISVAHKCPAAFESVWKIIPQAIKNNPKIFDQQHGKRSLNDALMSKGSSSLTKHLIGSALINAKSHALREKQRSLKQSGIAVR